MQERSFFSLLLALASAITALASPKPGDRMYYPRAASAFTTSSAFATGTAASAVSSGDVTCTVAYDHYALESVTASCICNNGMTHDLAPSSASPYEPCPPPTLGFGTTVTETAPTATPYTYTAYSSYGATTGGTVYRCDSSVIENAGEGISWTECAGSKVIISLPTSTPTPKLSLTMATGTATYIGQLTGSDLSASITSALAVACPTDSSTCTASTATIGNIQYPDEEDWEGLGDGYLEIGIRHSSYENSTMLDKLLDAAGQAVVQSTNDANMCYTLHQDDTEGRAGRERDFPVCDMTGGLNLEYYSGLNPDGPDDALWLDFNFRGQDGSSDITEEICESLMGAVGFLEAMLTIFAPEFIPEENIVNDIIKTGCEAAEEVEGSSDDGDE